MLNEIVNGIGLKLSKSFNGIDIHKEELEQGFEEPCFFIDLLNPSEKQIIGNRYLRSYLFDIVYFPKKKSSEEIFEVLDKLYSVLEYIELDDSTFIACIKLNLLPSIVTKHLARLPDIASLPFIIAVSAIYSHTPLAFIVRLRSYKVFP